MYFLLNFFGNLSIWSSYQYEKSFKSSYFRNYFLKRSRKTKQYKTIHTNNKFGADIKQNSRLMLKPEGIFNLK